MIRGSRAGFKGNRELLLISPLLDYSASAFPFEAPLAEGLNASNN